MSDAGDGTVKSLGIFSTLESATEFKFFLLALTFVLLVDNAFLQLQLPGLIELAADPKKIEAANLGLRVILIFVLFSFLTSLLFKIGAILVQEISLHTIGYAYISLDGYLSRVLGDDRFPKKRKFECVRPSELRRAAHMQKDNFYLKQYEDYMGNWIGNIKAMNLHSLYAFYCLVVLAWSWLIGRNGSNSIVAAISKYFGTEEYFSIVILGLVALFLYRLFRNDDPEWIYCPTLYAELEKQEVGDPFCGVPCATLSATRTPPQ